MAVHPLFGNYGKGAEDSSIAGELIAELPEGSLDSELQGKILPAGGRPGNVLLKGAVEDRWGDTPHVDFQEALDKYAQVHPIADFSHNVQHAKQWFQTPHIYPQSGEITFQAKALPEYTVFAGGTPYELDPSSHTQNAHGYIETAQTTGWGIIPDHIFGRANGDIFGIVNHTTPTKRCTLHQLFDKGYAQELGDITGIDSVHAAVSNPHLQLDPSHEQIVVCGGDNFQFGKIVNTAAYGWHFTRWSNTNHSGIIPRSIFLVPHHVHDNPISGIDYQRNFFLAHKSPGTVIWLYEIVHSLQHGTTTIREVGSTGVTDASATNVAGVFNMRGTNYFIFNRANNRSNTKRADSIYSINHATGHATEVGNGIEDNRTYGVGVVNHGHESATSVSLSAINELTVASGGDAIAANDGTYIRSRDGEFYYGRDSAGHILIGAETTALNFSRLQIGARTFTGGRPIVTNLITNHVDVGTRAQPEKSITLGFGGWTPGDVLHIEYVYIYNQSGANLSRHYYAQRDQYIWDTRGEIDSPHRNTGGLPHPGTENWVYYRDFNHISEQTGAGPDAPVTFDRSKWVAVSFTINPSTPTVLRAKTVGDNNNPAFGSGDVGLRIYNIWRYR